MGISPELSGQVPFQDCARSNDRIIKQERPRKQVLIQGWLEISWRHSESKWLEKGRWLGFRPGKVWALSWGTTEFESYLCHCYITMVTWLNLCFLPPYLWDGEIVKNAHFLRMLGKWNKWNYEWQGHDFALTIFLKIWKVSFMTSIKYNPSIHTTSYLTKKQQLGLPVP